MTERIEPRAVVVRAPGVYAVETTPAPGLGPYDVTCRLLYGSTCTATDQHLIAGELPIPGVRFPFVLGHESVGEVVAFGERVRNFREGDLITRVGYPARDGLNSFWGGFASVGIARDHAAMREDGLPEAAWKKARVNQNMPSNIDPRVIPMMVTWRETWSYAKRLGVTAGKTVLVLGSGGNGLAYMLHARNLGAAFIAASGSPARADAARRAGADFYVDYTDPQGLERLREAARDGYDILIDSVGRSGSLEAHLPLVATGGAAGVYGIEDLSDRMELIQRAANNVRIAGPFNYDEAEAHDEVVALLQQGKMDASIWYDIDAPFALDDFPRAIETVAKRRAVKALVRLS